MGASFGNLGRSAAESILFATSNPFIGLFIGLLITAIIQSSSTSTSMIVAIVASGSITISDAVPMIMGANIGTTLTSTIVALGYITNKNEFRRALAAGTVHDFFNILTVLVLFPLEYYYGFLSFLSQEIASLFIGSGVGNENAAIGFKLFDAIPITKYIVEGINNGLISIAVSFVLLFVSLKIVSRQLSKVLISEPKDNLQNLVFNNPFKSFGFGAGITAIVQSSSITTSLVIPFVATKRILLKNAMPFILGANIGTTFTAFLAVLFKSNAAASIAMTHLLFNVIGVMIFLPFPMLRNFIIKLASKFGALTFQYRLIGFTYIIITFFAIPFTLIYFNKSEAQITELTYLKNDASTRVVISKSDSRKTLPIFDDRSEGDVGTIKDDIIHVSRRNNIIFFNQDFFIMNDIGYCWDSENAEGKYQMCIEEILPSLRLNENLTFDSVFVFDLNFYNKKDLDSIGYKYYIDAKESLLLKYTKLDKSGNILIEDKLVSIQKKY